MRTKPKTNFIEFMKVSDILSFVVHSFMALNWGEARSQKAWLLREARPGTVVVQHTAFKKKFRITVEEVE